MFEFRASTHQDLPHVMKIWRRAVDATHDFLDPVDRAAIEAELSTFLPQANLLLAVDALGTPRGFMFLHEGHLEALFIDPEQHGKGIGKALGFYEHLGFERIGRSEQDGQGRPYPLVHLRYRSES